MASLSGGICFECDEPVLVGSSGWYRCRFCGFESLCTNALEFSGDGCAHAGLEEERAPASDDDRQAQLGLSYLSTSRKGALA